MTEEYQIIYEEPLQDAAWGTIGYGISSFNDQQAGEDHARRFGVLLKAAESETVGGVIAVVYWDWLYIDLMWIREDLRRHGYGRQLLASAEDAGRQKGAKHAHLDTFSFQAPEFYQKNGYRVFGELKDFPAGHTRYYMTKEL
jgi:GNAT superfamily N-acetyltransferase